MINFRELSKEVFYADEQVPKLEREDIDFLKSRVVDTKSERTRLCMHKDITASLHEMFIVIGNDAYVRPHKHLDKAESLHIIEGIADVVFLDEQGNVTDVICVGDYASDHIFYYRIVEPIYHFLIIKSSFLVCHEVTTGPFRRENTVFAPWSPEEGDMAGRRAFTNELAEAVNEFRAKGAGHRQDIED